jgi:Holliday junction resolvasome RuvABC endonuclease subunit
MSGVSFDDGILGLDIDTKHIGWSLVRGSHHITGHGRFRRDPFDKFLLMYSRWLRDLIQEQQPSVIAIESPFVGLPTAVASLYEMHGVTKLVLATFRGAYDYVHNQTWKAQICGSGNITTAEKKAGKIVRICNDMGFKVDQIDEADALCIALLMRKKLTGRVV